MPRKIIRGTGITAREITVYDANAGEAPPHKAWNDAVERGGLFGAVSQEALRTCEKILENTNAEAAPIDSPADFAQVIAKHIAYAKNEIQAGDADRAARFAFIAGMEWARATMKWGWEPDALRGEKVAGGERNAAHRTNARHETLRNERFRIMRARVPVVGVDNAAAECAAELGGKPGTIKQQWNRHNRKGGPKKKRDT